MSWKTSLTCSHCSKILKNPVELPCEDCICQEHLTEKTLLNANKIKCLKCSQEFEIKANVFKPVKLVKQLLDEHVYLSDAEKNLKLKLDDTIREFFLIYDELTVNKNRVEMECLNHFQELRRQIDLQREELKVRIDDVALAMIAETNKYEAAYLERLSKNLHVALNSFDAKSLEDELKKSEEAFRDPFLLQESIQEMQCERIEAIEKVQSILCDMNQVREHLKEQNEFKPEKEFSHDSFGLLCLNASISNDLFKSQIVTGKQVKELVNLCEFDLTNDKWSLLYRGSRDGFGAGDFHSKCDNKSNKLTLIRADKSNFVFGGFTTSCWDNSNQYKHDSNAFLFSLMNKDDKPLKMKIDSNHTRYAIYCSSKFGPTFGSGSDIYIADNANINTVSSVNLGNTYKHPGYPIGSKEAQSYLAGSYNFQLSDIEMYKKES